MHLTSGLNLNGATLYVEGELTIDNFWGNSMVSLLSLVEQLTLILTK